MAAKKSKGKKKSTSKTKSTTQTVQPQIQIPSLQAQQLQLEKQQKAREKLKQVFDLFQHEGVLEISDLGTAIRACNLNPTKAAIEQIKEDLGHEELIQYEQFEHVLLETLLTESYKGQSFARDTEDVILRAFEALDTEKQGYIETEKLVRLLRTYGEPFDEEEIKEMIHAAEDAELHMVRINEASALLASNSNF